MSLKVVCRRNPDNSTLVVGRCASDENLDHQWHELNVRLITHGIRDNPLVVLYVVIADWYGHFCDKKGIPYRRVTYRPSLLDQKETVYFIMPSDPDQLESLVRELVDDPSWDTTLTFCQALGSSIEALSPREWSKSIGLSCTSADGMMLEWIGSREDLDRIEAGVKDIAPDMDAEVVAVAPDEDILCLLGVRVAHPRMKSQ